MLMHAVYICPTDCSSNAICHFAALLVPSSHITCTCQTGFVPTRGTIAVSSNNPCTTCMSTSLRVHPYPGAGNAVCVTCTDAQPTSCLSCTAGLYLTRPGTCSNIVPGCAAGFIVTTPATNLAFAKCTACLSPVPHRRR